MKNVPLCEMKWDVTNEQLISWNGNLAGYVRERSHVVSLRFCSKRFQGTLPLLFFGRKLASLSLEPTLDAVSESSAKEVLVFLIFAVSDDSLR